MLKWVQQSQPALGADLKTLCDLAGCGWCKSGSKQTAASASWALRGLSAEDLLDESLSGELFSFIQCCARLYLADEQLLLLAATGSESIVPNFCEAGRQDVHQEAPNKLFSSQRHLFPAAAVPVVPPFERDLSVFQL